VVVVVVEAVVAKSDVFLLSVVPFLRLCLR